MKVEVGRKLQFPDVVCTSLLADIVLCSPEDNNIILVELTVPWEAGCQEAHERKPSKYQPLVQDCRDKGWQAWLLRLVADALLQLLIGDS